MAKALGKLKRVNLQDFWGEEFENFSSWIIQDDILEMVGEAIDIELTPILDEIPQNSQNNGGTVTKDVKNNTHVIIQGQLERITHEDLGSLISFASRFDARVVIWIASQISDEHKNVLDWLNKVTRGDIKFFGAELELWKIDDSAPAANFNLVSRPYNHEQSDGDSGEPSPASEKSVQKKETVAHKKGDWTKKAGEKMSSSQQEKSSGQSKEDISVRENFVYTKSY